MRVFVPLLLAACLPDLHAADLPALPAETPAEVRPHLQTLQRYYREVEQRQSGARAAAPAGDSKTGTIERGEAAKPTAAPQPERDPFAVTPELRSQRGVRGSSAIGANLYPTMMGSRPPPMKLKAIITGQRAAALIEIKPVGSDAEPLRMRVYEGDVLTLDDGSTFRVRAIRPGVVSLLIGTDPKDEYLLR